jgi:23S rRNA (cytosine1962-C5)-methyltransferase
MAVVRLARGRHHRVAAGHPWVYKTEVDQIHGNYRPGDIVDVVDNRGKFLLRGYINPNSMILVRALAWREEEINRDFWAKRLRAAWAYRQRMLPDTSSCRVVFAEADGLPGLIVDKFEDVLVIQTLALGIDIHKETLVQLLHEIIAPRGIYERNDVPVRELEGLEQRKGFLSAPFDPRLIITENGLKMHVDVAAGQKTGHFLDQRENRAAIRPFARGARVLDVFCNTGGFALNAAAAGAREVTAIDAQGDMIAAVQANAALNHLTINTVEGNAFDILRGLEAEKQRFDLIILDPPAFAKSKGALEGAARGYKEINLRALKMLDEGGFLVTCSCSQHMTPDLFRSVVADAARDAHKRLRLVAERAQALDHPIAVGYDESHYLKCLIYQVTA